MALLQISEPGKSPHPHQRKIVVGIDLGTSNSLVAASLGNTIETLIDKDGDYLLPSVVNYRKNDTIVGKRAKLMAVTDAHNTISSAKRLIGRGVEDIKRLAGVLPYRIQLGGYGSMPMIETRQGNVSPVEVSAEILKVLKGRAEDVLDGELSGAVITVPAYFDDAQRQATKDAAIVADINLLRLLSEPTAAAVAYGLDQSTEDQLIAVYDLGGGTFDISVLHLHQGVFKVLATGGDSALGGDDIDYSITEWVLEKNKIDANILSLGLLRELIILSKQAKETLTRKERTLIVWNNLTVELSRKKLEELVEPLVSKTIKSCHRALRDAGVTPEVIDEVVMVGGSSRMGYVRQRVESFFQKPPRTSLDPDKVVAIGAAIQANALAGNGKDDTLLLLDVVPLSLGIETMGGLMEKIIHRNATIPLAKAQDFTTHKDGQTGMVIQVLQGERELIKDNRSLAKFTLKGIPAMPAGMAKIRVTFQVDADGLLNVSAKELSSGVSARVEVKPSYGLNDEQIRQMLEDSYAEAVSDKENRLLIELRVEADRLLEALSSALNKDGNRHLSVQEHEEIKETMRALSVLKKTETDVLVLKIMLEKLNQLSENFAAKRMNAGVHDMLSGHSIDEFKE